MQVDVLTPRAYLDLMEGISKTPKVGIYRLLLRCIIFDILSEEPRKPQSPAGLTSNQVPVITTEQ